MTIKELLDKCEVNVGWTANARQYRFNGKLILDRATRTKNVWVEPIVYELFNLTEKELMKEISEYFNNDVKRVTIWAVGERGEMDEDLKTKLKDIINVYEKESGKKFNPSIVSGIGFPEPSLFILDEISNND